MVNMHDNLHDNPKPGVQHYTVQFKKPELKCEDPEYVVLGKLEPGEPLKMGHPICYRVNIVQSNKRGDGIMLKASFTGDPAAIRPIQLYVSKADADEWTAVEAEPHQSPQSRMF